MGYMGFGLQKWIYNLKPRKPFKKGTKGAGYETYQINRYDEFKLKDTGTNNPELADLRLNEAKKRFAISTQNERLFIGLIIIGIIVTIALIYRGVENFRSKGNENSKTTTSKISKERLYALELLIKSGKQYLLNNEINYAINDFKLALNIDTINPVALYYLTLALSIDCEKNLRSCAETIEYFEKLKMLHEESITDELEMRIVVVEEIIKKKNIPVANKNY